jgi:diguanylate cyclase (GGDEF)-like protein
MSQTVSPQERLLHRITHRIRQSLELSEILTTAVEEIRALLEVDRVKIYRFESDGSGEVVAESIFENRLPALIHLRFPASDIPDQSREMFVRVRQRVIVDVADQRKTVDQVDGLDSSDIPFTGDVRYSPADPCHIRYLSTMGVFASLVLPILHQNTLWGLLAVHHANVRHFSKRELQIVQLLVDQISIAIAQSGLLTQARRQAYHEATINQISSLLHCPLKAPEIRQAVLEAAVEALQGAGGRLYITSEPTGEPAQFYTIGEQPSHPFLEEALVWQRLLGWHTNMDASLELSETAKAWQENGRSLLHAYRTDLSSKHSLHLYTLCELRQMPQCEALVEEFERTAIRSIAIIPLKFHNQLVGCLTIFRNGYDTEIVWAGPKDSDDRNTMPRASFAAWREVKKDQAPTWSIDEVKLAQSIGLHLYMSITQKRVEALIRYRASHDTLTKLPNRLLFDEQLSLALIQAKQTDEMLGVAFLDLDRFKTINDTLGHAVGDQLLQEVAQRLGSCLRTCDVIARWGGDEFTLLLPHLNSAEDVTEISQRILDVLSHPLHINEQELYVTASLGIALAPYDGEDVETLLKNADAAMYQAKRRGKNNYQLYVEEINDQALERLALESDLRKAMLKDELLLHYQPQVNIYTGEIIGLEVLLRWQHTHLGLISPNQFIPLAEETGLICPIGDWVLGAACQQHQIWRAAGLPAIRLAVNLSARQFQQANLANSIIQILRETGMEPDYLELEITESAAMQDLEYTISTLKELRKIGVQITIDDFGTGYSSLNAIKHFPLHTLKLDQSFVREAIHSRSDAAIAQAVVSLGRGLGLTILAEGVETQEQLEFLRLIQCHSAQGYLFSRPVPAGEVPSLFHAQPFQAII